MSKFTIKIDLDALYDIQEATDWYNKQKNGLGAIFQKQVKNSINSLKTNPEKHAIRYANVHCLLVKKFPFLIHFSINNQQNIIEVYAVYHTSRNPKFFLK